MPTQLQLRGGTTVQHNTFTGLIREVTVDTTKDTLVVHDGSTVGGHELARADLSNVTLPTNTTYAISAETATGGVNIRLTGSDATTDNVKLAAGTNVTLTRTDADTITIAATGGGPGGGSGTVDAGVANALAYYPSAGTTVDDLSAITWNSVTTTLSVVGTVSATDFVSTGTGTPNFSSDTDLEIITNASVLPKSFTFDLNGGFLVGDSVTGTPSSKSFEIEGGINDRFFRAESNMSAYSNTTTAVIDLLSYRSSPASGQRGVGIDLRQSTASSPNAVAASIFTTLTDATPGSAGTSLTVLTLKNDSLTNALIINSDGITVPNTITFGTAPFRIVAAPTSSIGATGDKAGDVAMNGTSIFYCTAVHDGTTNIWVKSAWTTTGAW